ncbi:hypothetical protein Dsui_0177 [Azospira oryzae PS]|uniref:RecT family n=1 Tax=Azospira oryzae (strain ATCC BAA-33 / DSM 13638 / PS) TaxID=640081 RepID=G8QM81_AZOOP|nr:hypothetical protein [Azospira oryzae]AEV24597.1 hypothetical protein Dsui_0177 [Azospira oryzae PS]
MSAQPNSADLTAMRQQQLATREANLPSIKAGFFDVQSFELLQRTSNAFSRSDLVPKSYQGNLPNTMIAMDMAQRIGANPLMVMQNLYIVHGTPGWSSKFLIATINACGRYSSLRYEWKGEPGQDDYGCRAWAVERETGERLNGIWVTWKMVKAEGWDSKNGSKWKTMPDQMFVYRAAAFWQRAYAPELGMGLQTTEDLEDTFDARRGPDGAFSVDLSDLKPAAPGVDTETGEIIEGAPAAADPDDAALQQLEQQGSGKPAGGFQPTAEEIAEASGQQTTTSRPRRERGGMGIE